MLEKVSNTEMMSLLWHPEAIFFFPEGSHGFNGVLLLYVILYRLLSVLDIKGRH